MTLIEDTPIEVPAYLLSLHTKYSGLAPESEVRQFHLSSPAYCALRVVQQEADALRRGSGIDTSKLIKLCTKASESPFVERRVVAGILGEMAVDYVIEEKQRREQATQTQVDAAFAELTAGWATAGTRRS